MLRIIDGLKYDTESGNAELILKYEPDEARDSANWYTENLYKTSKGRWFFAGRGGAKTEYAAEVEAGEKIAGENIFAVSPETVVDYLRDLGEDDIIEQHLAEHVEEA